MNIMIISLPKLQETKQDEFAMNKKKHIVIIIGILIIAMAFTTLSNNPALAATATDNTPNNNDEEPVRFPRPYWCHFVSLSAKSGDNTNRYIEFNASGEIDVTQATFEVTGLGKFEVQGLKAMYKLAPATS